MLRATELGLRVTKPCVVILRSALFARRRTWARRAYTLAFFARMLNRAFGALPKLPYDLVIEINGRFLRGRSYKCHLDSNGHAYSPDQIDFIAAYIIPTDTWYILPIRPTKAQPDILLNPRRDGTPAPLQRCSVSAAQGASRNCG